MATPRRSPKPAAALTPLADPEVEPETTWEDVEVSGQLEPSLVEGLEIRQSRLRRALLTGMTFEDARWRDVIVEASELSGVGLEAAALTRVEFVDSRLTGAVFGAARIADVAFVRCRMEQSTFRMSTTERIEFIGCDLRGADFQGASLLESAFLDCDLTGADFSQAKLKGSRFHGSVLTDVRGGRSFAGVQIDAAQLVPMALGVFDALGITITEPGD